MDCKLFFIRLQEIITLYVDLKKSNDTVCLKDVNPKLPEWLHSIM